MKKRKIIIISISCILAGLYLCFYFLSRSSYNPNSKYSIGEPIDSFHGVKVYYNGMVRHTGERNVTDSGYNIGMKYQCVEFVKRYYFERFHHKMPDAFGNAKDFFDGKMPDSTMSPRRGLLQFSNGSHYQPQVEDLIIFDGHPGNPYGHVAIIDSVTDSTIEIIQQNPGPFAPSRVTFSLNFDQGKWTVKTSRVLGWLRMGASGGQK